MDKAKYQDMSHSLRVRGHWRHLPDTKIEVDYYVTLLSNGPPYWGAWLLKITESPTDWFMRERHIQFDKHQEAVDYLCNHADEPYSYKEPPHQP